MISIVAIGASAGGLPALQSIFGALPADLPAAFFVTMHIGVHPSQLPSILSREGRLSFVHPQDGEPIRAGTVYIAPPDRHLILEPGRLCLSRGPRENRTRPAIDPMFRSAASAYGGAVIGLVLTGGLNDGTAGLYEIKARGGMTIVQDPADAVQPSMPLSALRNVGIDHCLPLSRIPALLVRLVAARGAAEFRQGRAAGQGGDAMSAGYVLDRPVAVTCPDCGGALRQSQLGGLTQFRCHIGHVYTAEVMLAAQLRALEQSVEMALRSLNERAELCRQMAERSAGQADRSMEAKWLAAMREAEDKTAPLRQLLETDWLSAVAQSGSDSGT